MINVQLARREQRLRDEQRRRLILTISHKEGVRNIHITREEARKLAQKLIQLSRVAETIPLF